jgi:Tol biopolymer transport system component
MTETPELEARLRRGLTDLAEEASAAPDALDRIMAGRPRAGGGADLRLVRSVRDRTGHRNRRRALGASGLAAAVAAALFLVSGTTAPRRSRPPTAVLQAAAGPRSLEPVAYVAGGRLYVAGGTGGRPVIVASTGDPEDPQWSPDHQWLAYVTRQGYRVHLVRADGTGDRVVATTSPVNRGALAWAPGADELAVVPGLGGVTVVPATGGVPLQPVPATVPIESMAWSRDGSRIAYSTPARPGVPGTVQVVPATGGVARSVPVQLAVGSDALLATWWPDGSGLLFWVDPDGSPLALEEGLVLESAPLAGGTARPLVTTLVYHPWLTWSPDGSRLLVVAGAGASPAAGKRLALCDVVAATCSALSQPAGTVSIDPAWSPDGTEIAFVRAADTGQPANLDVTPGWFPTRRLWVEAADGSGAHPVAGAGAGAVLPAWSPDGRFIGYSTGTGLATVPAGGGGTSSVATGLAGSNDGTSGPDANGKGPWLPSAVWGSRGGFFLSPP